MGGVIDDLETMAGKCSPAGIRIIRNAIEEIERLQGEVKPPPPDLSPVVDRLRAALCKLAPDMPVVVWQRELAAIEAGEGVPSTWLGKFECSNPYCGGED